MQASIAEAMLADTVNLRALTATGDVFWLGYRFYHDPIMRATESRG